MSNTDHLTVDALVTDHLPLVGYAVTELSARLPHTLRLEALAIAGVTGLRLAAQSFRDTRGGDFVRYARPRISAALSAAVAGSSMESLTPGSAVADVRCLMAQMEPAVDASEATLLHQAHPSAFAVSQRPRHGAGHYAAVAAASDSRTRRDAAVADAEPLHRFGT